MKGNGLTNNPPIYGIQGVPDPLNTPGERTFAAASWVDTSGNFWLYGGVNINSGGADLWKYDPGTNEWTWMHGSQSFAAAVHGTQGIPSPLNMPGIRNETAAAWTDSLNNLWLFGGNGFDGSAVGVMNDLMKYDIANNEWTWMSGSAFANAPPAWGIKNVSAATNDPGGRSSYTHWLDNSGGLYMMGGHADTAYYNDMWRYDMNTNIWTWVAGTNMINDTGRYASTCVFDSVNIPEARTEQRSSVQDGCGNFWMFGGINQRSLGHVMNDLWIFDHSTLEWSWLHGSNQINPPFSFGTKGIPSPTNLPIARAGAIAWWGNDNRFYMFGGTIDNTGLTVCDMWVYAPDSSCLGNCSAVVSAQFDSPDSICPGTCINFTNLSVNASSYQWIFPGGNPSSSNDVDPQSICYANPGNYDVTLIATNGNSSDTLLLANYISVFPIPPAQGIFQSGDTLFANPGSASYQWFFNGSIIPGATNYFYVALASGNYNVVATDTNECEVEAVINNVLAYAHLAVGNGQLAIYPNPVTEKLYVKHSMFSDKAFEISIYNVMGEKIHSAAYSEPITVDCEKLLPGIYFIQLNLNNKIIRTKFVKSTN